MKKIIMLLFLIFSVMAFTEPIRKLSVTGNAEREIMPDIATINFRVYTKNEDLKKAGKENETNFENFKNELKKKNIATTNLTTNNYFSQKTFEAIKDSKEKDEFLTTLVFSVRVTDYSKIPALIDLAEKNSIKNFKSDSYDKTLYLVEVKKNNSQKNTSIAEAFGVYDTIKKQLSNLGIYDNDISIYSYSNSTSKVRDRKQQKKKETYNIYNDFSIQIKDINKINEVIKIAENNKINLQGNIAFDISNKDEIESDLYNKAYELSKTKATSILKSSNMTLGDPLVVSENVSYQNIAIQEDYYYDKNIAIKGARLNDSNAGIYEMSIAAPAPPKPVVNYKPQMLKLSQNVSILFEIK